MTTYKSTAITLVSIGLLTVTLSGFAVPLAQTQTTAYWQNQGQLALQKAMTEVPNTRRAKNVILFVGDGNGIASVTATRIFDGQSKGQSGEENVLSFEQFPNVALSKTYNTNQQTPDSAGTMTAIVTGIKTLSGVLSMGPEVTLGNCKDTSQFSVPTILEQVQARGYATGLVSTARITHATPAATYAHVPERDWEIDTAIPDEMKPCATDIARQMIESGNIDVALGGGRKNFLTIDTKDPEYADKTGARADGRDLTQEWQAANPTGKYIWNKAQFDQLSANFSGPLLGLFEPSHMQYETDRSSEPTGEPSLADMTQKAISVLKQHENGFFLMVEAGRIDHAHHAGNAYRAMVDGQMLSAAVQVAVDSTRAEDTLIIVTADHSHVLTIAGYPTRGNPILGKVVHNDAQGKPTNDPALAADGNPYTTLSYANGPGYGFYEGENARYAGGINAGRKLQMDDDTTDPNFHQESLVPTPGETHGGEDVAIYARGPWAHLIRGVQEQSYIYYVMRQALGF